MGLGLILLCEALVQDLGHRAGCPLGAAVTQGLYVPRAVFPTHPDARGHIRGPKGRCLVSTRLQGDGALRSQPAAGGGQGAARRAQSTNAPRCPRTPRAMAQSN